MFKTAILVFASDEESKAEISESDVDFPGESPRGIVKWYLALVTSPIGSRYVTH